MYILYIHVCLYNMFYIYVHVCMYLYMHACMCVCIHVCACVYIWDTIETECIFLRRGVEGI